ncbi:MAG TPA: TIGR02206 family membrane protein [Vicinamibacteria bacterium]|nr:TIGR02206 family membrane protein [Vicinamibacteria bacterium]
MFSDPAPPFVLFGVAHVTVLLGTVLLALVLARRVRARPSGALAGGFRYALATLLLAIIGFEMAMGVAGGWLTLQNVLPLQLCDLAMLLAVYSLIRLDRRTAELLYFWALAGSGLAMVTPDLRQGFPRWEFLAFFGLHGLVVVAALVLTFGFGLRPRPGSARRAFLATAGYAALVGGVNAMLGTNFMFLRARPATPTILDWFGPWPLYIVAAGALAFCLFWLLALPFRRPPAPPAASPPAPAPPYGGAGPATRT